MKNKMYFLSFLLLSLGFLTACSSDDDYVEIAPPTIQEMLLGKWVFEETGFESNGVIEWETSFSECPTKPNYFYFNESTLYGHSFDEDCLPYDVMSFEYIIEGKLIIATSIYGDETLLRIEEITPTELHLSETVNNAEKAHARFSKS